MSIWDRESRDSRPEETPAEKELGEAHARIRELEGRVQALFDANKLLLADNERLGGKYPYPYVPTKGELDRYGAVAFAATDARCRELEAANKRLQSRVASYRYSFDTIKHALDTQSEFWKKILDE